MIIADTNVVSEFMKEAPDPAVLRWAEALDPAALSICVITVEEIARGLGRLPQGRRRRDLERRWAALLEAYADRILTYGVEAARLTAGVLITAEAEGRPMGLADAQIAGICLAVGHQLATRNVRDFEHVSDLIVINPFE